jgi:hypothetical protein
MNPLPNKTAARAIAALGFLSMAAIGWKMADQPERQAAASPQAETAEPTKRPARTARSSGPPEAVRQRMASLRAIASPEERMRATIDLACHLPASEIAAWMEGRWFNTGAGFDLTLFNKILIERWAKEDPEGLLLFRLKNNSSESGNMIATWAETDPERVLAFFKEHPARELQLRSLAEIARKNPAFALQCLMDLPPGGASANHMDGYYKRQVLAELAKSSPAALEAALDSFPPGMRNLAELLMIGQRLQTSFDSEFPKLLERPDGWKILSDSLSNGSDLKGKLFEQLANLPAGWKSSLASSSYNAIDSANASQWWNADLEGLGFTTKDAKRIRLTALARMASRQPEDALKLMAASEFDANERRNVIANIFSNHRENAETLLGMLDSEEEKMIARAYLPSNSDSSSGGGPIKIETPTDWLDQVGSGEFKSDNSYQYLSMLRGWDSDKIAELGTQFRSLPDEKKTQVARVIADHSGHAGHLGPAFVSDAIWHLVAQAEAPNDENRGYSSDPIVQASDFAVNWSKIDPDAASQWVQSLPAGDAKLWAQKNLAATWTQYDPEAVEQWIKTLPADSRGEVEKFIQTDNKVDKP